MAIKFSQFVVQTDASTLSHVVGYNGVDNIQITPTNFLNSLLTGTAGQVLFYDTTGVTGDNSFYWDNTNKRLGIGIASPIAKLHVYQNNSDDDTTAGVTIEQDGTGDAALSFLLSTVRRWRLGIDNNDLDKFKISSSTNLSTNNKLTIDVDGNVGIGTNTPGEKLEVSGNIKVGDSEQFVAGTGNDLKIYHDGTDSVIQNDTGDLEIQNRQDDGDIIFKSDDGSGGVTEYFRLDGGTTSVVVSASLGMYFNDGIAARFGNGGDFIVYHDATDSYLSNGTGDLIIRNTADDKDIIFQSDDGSGGLDTYFTVVGAGNRVQYNKNLRLIDNAKATFGSSDDLQIHHDGTNSLILNDTGRLIIRNRADDQDIEFDCDDGAGGVATYFYLDGGGVLTRFDKRLRMSDAVSLQLGSSGNFEMYHFSGNTTMDNFTGNLTIRNSANDKDISFACDDGSGGTAEYFKLDGSRASGAYTYTTRPDGGVITFGDGLDLRLWHDPNTNKSYVRGYNNDLYIEAITAGTDIAFRADDGSGGVTTYFQLDGSATTTVFSKNTRYNDNVELRLGSGSDFKAYHSGTNTVLENNTGHLFITNGSNDGDVVFKSDDGSGGTATYFALDGGITRTVVYKNFNFQDNVKLEMGTGADLQIYHDGSHSYIKDTGTGVLKLLGSGVTIQNAAGSENMAVFTENDTVILYNNGVEKLRTIGSGVKISGVSEYANNTAALAGGLVVGDVYRTGDDLKIVH